MSSADAYRALVTARAGGACEYCRLLELATGVTFHVEHVVPRVQQGQTAMSNLALSCPGCNLSKGGQMTGEDDDGNQQPLFRPRQYEPWLLGWHLHFELDRQTGFIVPRTKIGQATAKTLQFNSAARVFARRLQLRAGLIG